MTLTGNQKRSGEISIVSPRRDGILYPFQAVLKSDKREHQSSFKSTKPTSGSTFTGIFPELALFSTRDRDPLPDRRRSFQRGTQSRQTIKTARDTAPIPALIPNQSRHSRLPTPARSLEIIAKNIDIWRKYNHKLTKLYVLCGFDSIDEVDIGNTLERIRILMEHGAIPYIMRYENYVNSRYRGLYVQLARWCNQPQFFKKKSFREYCEACQDYYIAHSEHRKRELCAPLAEMRLFESEHPAIAKKYFGIRFDRQGQ